MDVHDPVGHTHLGVDLRELETEVDDHARREIVADNPATVPDDRITAAVPAVRLRRLGDHHLVVRVIAAGRGIELGASSEISTWGVLRHLDRCLALDEIQGLPCEHWEQLRAARRTAKETR